MFQGRFGASANAAVVAPIRPPWSRQETQFIDACTQCDKCLSACDEGIVIRGAGGYPEIDFQRGECTFCGDCAKVCTPGAIFFQKCDQDLPQQLPPALPSALPWSLDAKISSACLSAKAITCRVCGDRCDARAIRFQLSVGGIADPIIDQTACTGCGACVAPCPVNAVVLIHSQVAPRPHGVVEVIHSQMEELS
ncbi:MAG: ferredoxin-type protein NapF [Magnetovibrio sp.]|nr:ferredoxin-type protein NapF [Magnetovibrio sp.]